MRALASIRRIDSIAPIEGADSIEAALVGGWSVVVKKGEFETGDVAVYFEIDSFIPHELAPFLTKSDKPAVYNEVKGNRLRTIKLRGQLSQGLLLPLSHETAVKCEAGVALIKQGKLPLDKTNLEQLIGCDVTELLGIQKYEPPVPANLAGQAKGAFPSAFSKTDQERIQNLTEELKSWADKNYHFVPTEKLEGSSMTVYLLDGQFGVASRNWDLQPTQDNTLWAVAAELQLEQKMRKLFFKGTDEAGQPVYENVALQGELVGPGIQSNPYKLQKPDFYLFHVIGAHGVGRKSIEELVSLAKQLGIHHVPVLGQARPASQMSVQDLLIEAEGASLLRAAQTREGIVHYCVENPNISFKAISNLYLLKQDARG